MSDVSVAAQALVADMAELVDMDTMAHVFLEGLQEPVEAYEVRRERDGMLVSLEDYDGRVVRTHVGRVVAVRYSKRRQDGTIGIRRVG